MVSTLLLAVPAAAVVLTSSEKAAVRVRAVSRVRPSWSGSSLACT